MAQAAARAQLTKAETTEFAQMKLSPLARDRNVVLAPGFLERAQGCLLGQLAGDALGGLVEFQRPEDIQMAYPHGVRELADGGTWGTLAGQPTDDSEMALALARLLADQGRFDHEKPGKRTSALTESFHNLKEILCNGHPTDF